MFSMTEVTVVTSVSYAKCVLVVTCIKHPEFKTMYSPSTKFYCHCYSSSLQFNKGKAHGLEKCPLTANKLGLNAYDLINSIS